jgi:uncharacterized protein YdcH (DUF465 family)
MKLSSFSENIVKETFEHDGEKVELHINIDAIVPDYYAALDERLKPVSARFDVLQEKYDELQEAIEKRAKERGKRSPLPTTMLVIEKERDELMREMCAEKLTCPVMLPNGSTTTLLKAWTNVTDENGKAIPPSKENLMQLPPKTVAFLWDLCSKRANTVKKRDDEEETLESTHDGSAGLRVVGQTA